VGASTGAVADGDASVMGVQATTAPSARAVRTASRDLRRLIKGFLLYVTGGSEPIGLRVIGHTMPTIGLHARPTALPPG
jgi:hypothetical protein